MNKRIKIKRLKQELNELKNVDLHSAREHIKDLRITIKDKDALLGAINFHAHMDSDQERELTLKVIRDLTKDVPVVMPSRKDPTYNHLF